MYTSVQPTSTESDFQTHHGPGKNSVLWGGNAQLVATRSSQPEGSHPASLYRSLCGKEICAAWVWGRLICYLKNSTENTWRAGEADWRSWSLAGTHSPKPQTQLQCGEDPHGCCSDQTFGASRTLTQSRASSSGRAACRAHLPWGPGSPRELLWPTRKHGSTEEGRCRTEPHRTVRLTASQVLDNEVTKYVNDLLLLNKATTMKKKQWIVREARCRMEGPMANDY